MIQNLSETEIHNIIKFLLTQQLLKSLHLLRESGDVVDGEDVSFVGGPSVWPRTHMYVFWISNVSSMRHICTQSCPHVIGSLRTGLNRALMSFELLRFKTLSGLTHIFFSVCVSNLKEMTAQWEAQKTQWLPLYDIVLFKYVATKPERWLWAWIYCHININRDQEA